MVCSLQNDDANHKAKIKSPFVKGIHWTFNAVQQRVALNSLRRTQYIENSWNT